LDFKSGLKTRYAGIPAFAIITLLVGAGIVAAALVTTMKFKTTTAEPLAFEKIDGLDIAYQGDSDSITVSVSNKSSETPYGIYVDTELVDEQVESISYSSTNLVASEPAKGSDFNGDGDKVDAKYNISKGGSFDIVVTVDSADDVKPGEVEVKLDFHRKGEY